MGGNMTVITCQHGSTSLKAIPFSSKTSCNIQTTRNTFSFFQQSLILVLCIGFRTTSLTVLLTTCISDSQKLQLWYHREQSLSRFFLAYVNDLLDGIESSIKLFYS